MDVGTGTAGTEGSAIGDTGTEGGDPWLAIIVVVIDRLVHVRHGRAIMVFVVIPILITVYAMLRRMWASGS